MESYEVKPVNLGKLLVFATDELVNAVRRI